MNKTLKFAKITGKCGHTNLTPIIEVFNVYDNIKCEKCGKVIAEPKEPIDFWKAQKIYDD